jgi:nucleotide-binding universal stress UspA family protein
MRWREAGALGILMNTRGLMELIVLNLGLDLGVISPTLFTMMVVMALVTTFMTTPLLKWLYPPDEMAKDRIDVVPVTPTAAPAPFTVLTCVSHGQAGPGLAQLSHALTAGEASRAQVYALHLVPSTERASLHLKQDSEPPQEGALAPLLGRARALGLDVRPLSFISTEPGTDICRTAEAKRADLILLGWHKPLFSRTVLGGTVHEVMQGAGSDVAVLVDRGLKGIRRILVPFIGSPDERAALGLARRLLRQEGAEVTLLHVVEPERTAARSETQARVEDLFPEEAGRVRFQVVAHASPEEAALEEARKGYDLVVVGVGARWGLESHLFGLHRERIIQECPASLLIVRHPVAATAEAPGAEPAGVLSADRAVS